VKIVFKNRIDGRELSPEALSRQESLVGVAKYDGRHRIVPVQFDEQGNGPYFSPLWELVVEP
jgi:hypothetical protein